MDCCKPKNVKQKSPVLQADACHLTIILSKFFLMTSSKMLSESAAEIAIQTPFS
jgi:hypothetical protein